MMDRPDHSKEPIFVGPVVERKATSGRKVGYRFSIISKTTLGQIDFDYVTKSEAIKSREALSKGDNAYKVPTIKLFLAISCLFLKSTVHPKEKTVSTPPSTAPSLVSDDR